MQTTSGVMFRFRGLHDVNAVWLKQQGITAIAIDWENTCEPLVRKRPWVSKRRVRVRKSYVSDRTKAFLHEAAAEGMPVCIASNSTSSFLRNIVEQLSRDGIHVGLVQPPKSMWWSPWKKESPHKLQPEFWWVVSNSLNMPLREIVMIGDKYLFDCKPALDAGFGMVIKVNPLGKDLLLEQLVGRRRRDNLALAMGF